MPTLLIADDHQLFRRGLRQLCEVAGGFTALAEAETGAQAVALARQLKPDVILMDIRMPDLNGVAATRQILRDNPAARIIILTMYRQDHHVAEAIKAGACGYLLKNCDEETLFAAIRAAARGEGAIDPAIAPSLLEQFALLSTAVDDATPPLSPGEMEVLRLVAHGADNQTIAAELHLSPGTVANRLRHIYQILGVSNRTQAALYALRRGWASLDAED